MKTIHKFLLDAKPGIQSQRIRKNAILRKVDAQADKLAFWYELDTHNDWVDETLMIMHTGDEFDAELFPRREYIDTVLFDNAMYVLHVYRIH